MTHSWPKSQLYGLHWQLMIDRAVRHLRRLIEGWLPWFDRRDRDARAANTEAIRRTAIRTRKHSERVLLRAELDGAVASFRRPR